MNKERDTIKRKLKLSSVLPSTFYILYSIFILTSCCSTRKIQTVIAKIDTAVVVPPPVDHSRSDSLAFIEKNYRELLRNQIDFTTFSAKIDVDYREADGKKYDVNAHVRMYRDSVIWISVTALLGIEGLRAYITKDSVKLLDKQNKIYTARSVAYLQEVTALPLDLHSLQDLLIGNPVFIDSTIVSYSLSGTELTLLSIGSFFKNLLTISAADKLMQSSKLDDVQEGHSRTCYLTYDKYETRNGISFPTLRTISVSEKKKLDIRLNFKQYEFNEKLSFPFPIPKNYEMN
jgi:hypothetical protein